MSKIGNKNFIIMKNNFLQEVLICALLFFMPLAYTYPGRIYSHVFSLHNIDITSLMHLFLLPSIILACALIIIRIYQESWHFLAVYPKKDFLSIVIVLLVLFATISYLINQKSNIGTIKYMSVYISLLLVHFSVKNLKFSERFYINIFVWLAFGCVFLLTLGILSFIFSFNYLLLIHKWLIANYLSNGNSLSHKMLLHVPSGNILSHKILTYMANAFGNVGNMAAFLVLIVPPIFSQLINKHSNVYHRILFGSVIIMALINLVIVGSRAAFVIILLFIISVCFVRGRKAFFVCLGALVILFLVMMIWYPKYVYTETARIYAAATFDQKQDYSVSGRIQTMKSGLKALQTRPLFGSGINTLVKLRGRDTTVHQFNLRMAVDIGIFGGIMSIILCLLSFIKPIKIICSKRRSEKFNLYALSIGPAAFFAYAMLAGAPLAIGVVNTWVVICIIFLTLSYYFEPTNVK